MGTAGIVLAHGLVQGVEIGDQGHVQEGMIVKVLGDPLFMLFRYDSHINSPTWSPSCLVISVTILKLLRVMSAESSNHTCGVLVFIFFFIFMWTLVPLKTHLSHVQCIFE